MPGPYAGIGYSGRGLVLITPPADEPVTVAEVKLFARIPNATDDVLVGELVTAARLACEEWRGRAFLTQTWDFFLDAFPRVQGAAFYTNAFPQATNRADLPIALPRQPLQTVISLTYYTSDGQAHVLDPSTYFVDTANVNEPRILPAIGTMWPFDLLRIANGVAVRFVAGYGSTPDSVPTHLQMALRQLVAYWYVNRDSIGVIPDGVMELLAQSQGGFAYA